MNEPPPAKVPLHLPTLNRGVAKWEKLKREATESQREILKSLIASLPYTDHFLNAAISGKTCQYPPLVGVRTALPTCAPLANQPT